MHDNLDQYGPVCYNLFRGVASAMVQTTETPVVPITPVPAQRKPVVQLTETAVAKVREILSTQEPKPAGLRIAVVGGGCSGFSYSMAFENSPGMLDKTIKYDDLKVFIDQASLLYLEGAEVDYVESLEGSGFKFNNPNVKSTCGCGSSFSA